LFVEQFFEPLLMFKFQVHECAHKILTHHVELTVNVIHHDDVDEQNSAFTVANIIVTVTESPKDILPEGKFLHSLKLIV